MSQNDLALPLNGRRRALLVGINDYSASSLTAPAQERPSPVEQRSWRKLQGSVNDVNAIEDMIVGRFEFAEEDVLVLRDQEATRDAILEAIRQHLVEKATTPGDFLFFHYSGHGSQVPNSASEEADKLDESIVPADSRLGAPDIRDKELRGLFNEALDRGARLTVVLDCCHSGSGVRGVPDGAVVRRIEPSERGVADANDYGPPIESRGAVVLSATQPEEYAAEASGPHDLDQDAALSPPTLAVETMDAKGKRYGAFTLALLRALRATPNWESCRYVFKRTYVLMSLSGRYQCPALEGLPERLAEPLFGGAAVESESAVVVEKVYGNDRVRVKGGWIDALAAGTDLLPLAGETGPALRVYELDGLRWSWARIASEGGDRPKPGTLYKAVNWVAANEPLRVWIPTDTAPEVVDNLRIGQGTEHDAIEIVKDPGQATYFLAGRRHEGNVEYAWVRSGAVAENLPGPEEGRRDLLLTLPLRSRWHALSNNAEDTARDLRNKVLRLYKIYAWNLLETPRESREAFPYHLVVTGPDGAVVEDRKIYSRQTYHLALRRNDGADIHVHDVERRYVYVFAIDGSGSSSLLYPRRFINTENVFPGPTYEGGKAPELIPLGPNAFFEVVEPFGFDTFFLFSSAVAIEDPPLIFGGDGVRGSALPRKSMLDILLTETGSTTRGARSLATKFDWSIDRVVFQTMR